MAEKKADKAPVLSVPRSAEQARVAYDRISKVYDLLAGSEKPFIDRGLQVLNLRKGETALEIGFGTGHALLAMARAVGEMGKVRGIDISPGMLEIAKAKVEQAGFGNRVELRCDDATRLPYDRGAFDALFMSFTLELFDTPLIPLVLHECRRVLRSSGRMCVVAMTKSEHPGLAVKLYEWMHKQFPAAIDCRPIYVQQDLRASGFQVVKYISDSMWGLPVDIVLAKPAGNDLVASSRTPH